VSEVCLYRPQLEAGLKAMKLSFPDSVVNKLLGYHQLLVKWNKAYNLTAIRDPEQMIQRHLLDSLSIAPYINGKRFIDVGTGAGLPGMIMAIIFPEQEWHLLDSNGKKTRFLFQVKTQLGLDNVTVHNCRVESLQCEQKFDGVMSRAFATLHDMISGSQQLLKPSGYFYAMKGQYPEQELRELGKNYIVDACPRLQVPGESGERHLIIIRSNDVINNA
jgi:16S rRNA (guanine527-N7)-methyltransferase